ncbi:N4-gp56 family major capsid protein [Bacillus litorisediminis]|uniref:N4-gp56 family major capsid protein n=1 Tax=Bacillus litorisediminis TaxID=2922713 RepID=UPI001FAFF4A5|nr:N4-gp56 family major capsid protein [Bacillus litorisediminis]
MTQTKLANLVNPQVMADMISAKLPSKIKFAPLARIDDTLVGQAGDTVTIPKYAYIGDADDLTEGVAMGTVVLSASTQTATIKQAGKAVEITDKAALAGYGDPVGEAERQLEMSIASKVDVDCVTALGGATLTHDASTAVISYDSIVDGVDKFEEEDDEEKVLFIHPLQKGTLRKDPNFIENVPNAFMTGVIGEIAGCQVVASNKVPKVSDGAGGFKYENLIVKPGALAIYLKRDVMVESDRDILAKTTVISADEHYVAALEDESKVVKLVTKA